MSGTPCRLAVIGSANVDYVSYVDRLPEPGETKLAERLDVSPGGKGANQAYALGRLGAEVAFFGAVGVDDHGTNGLRALREVGVTVDHVLRVEEPTGMASITVDDRGENHIVVAQGANTRVTPDYIDSVMSTLADCDIVLLQLEIPLATVTHAARILHERGVMVILDPAPAQGPLPAELLSCVDILKPNRSELAALVDAPPDSDPDWMLSELRSQGARCIVTSLGASGAIIVHEGGARARVDAERVTAIDTTGAGDSLTAALAVALASGADLESAVRFGMRVAAIVVQRRGAQESIPDADEVGPPWASLTAAAAQPGPRQGRRERSR